MTNGRSWNLRLLAAPAIIVQLSLLLAACGRSSHTNAHSTPAQSATAASGAGGVKIAAATGSAGKHLVGASGRAIYLWVADKGSTSTCSGACAENWPPVTTKLAPVAGSGVNAADLGTTTRPNDSKQVTYNGHPQQLGLMT
jgi:predicted lipoprotein with Yx(FWY)xxD motif